MMHTVLTILWFFLAWFFIGLLVALALAPLWSDKR